MSILEADPPVPVPPVEDAAELETLITNAVTSSNANHFEQAESFLREAIAIDSTDPRIAPHLSRIRFLKSRSTDPEARAATQDMMATIGAMTAEIRNDPRYVPSEFWQVMGKVHLDLLQYYGVENFKRTVSHNYQNWPMISLEDPQVQRLFQTWQTHFKCEPWLNTMEVPDHVGFHSTAAPGKQEYRLADAKQREVYRVAVGLLWEYVLSNDTCGILNGLDELTAGNPLRIWRHGRLISSDLAHSVRERNMLLESLKLDGRENLTVAELGAGHGRLAEVFGRTTNYRFFIFDVTPALYVSQWYVKSIFPHEKIFEFRHFDTFAEIEEELRGCRYAFFTANQIEMIPNDSINLFINMNSLMEMRAEQIRIFLDHIDRLTTTAFLSRQWIKWKNPVDEFTVSKKDFGLSSRWHTVLDQIDDIHPSFFNQIWRKA